MGALTFLCRWSREGGNNGIVLVEAMDTSAVITLGGVPIPALGECTWLAVILHGDCCSSCCLSKSETGNESAKEILSKSDFFPDKLSMLNKEDWSLCMALLLFS